jgi:hypothetical protein
MFLITIFPPTINEYELLTNQILYSFIFFLYRAYTKPVVSVTNLMYITEKDTKQPKLTRKTPSAPKQSFPPLHPFNPVGSIY